MHLRHPFILHIRVTAISSSLYREGIPHSHLHLAMVDSAVALLGSAAVLLGSVVALLDLAVALLDSVVALPDSVVALQDMVGSNGGIPLLLMPNHFLAGGRLNNQQHNLCLCIAWREQIEGIKLGILKRALIVRSSIPQVQISCLC